MAVELPLIRELAFDYGVIEQVAPGIRRLVANNPSPFTLYGTGTYIIGEGDVAVVDPGPADPDHIEALVSGLAGERITHVLVTHTHMDHSPGCALLAAHTDAPTYAFGPHGSGKAADGVVVEEGGDMDFVPDVLVTDGQIIEGNGWSVECVYTPGHTSNHICFAYREQKTLFTGDHVMGWSTSIVSPPDGDMAAYLDSLNKLLLRDDETYWPTHGACVTKPKELVRAFIAHREERSEQILKCLGSGIGIIGEMVPAMYTDLPEFMYPAAARSVFAAIELLVRRGEVVCDGEPGLESRYSVTG